jgi:hypothetical protein
MPAFASIILKDSAAANVTFAPQSIDANGVARYTGTSSDSATAGSVTSFDSKRFASSSVSMPKNGSKVVRVKQKVGVPVFTAVTPFTKIGDAVCNIEWVLPVDAGQGDLTDLKAHVIDMVTLSLTTDAVTSFQPVY